MIAAGATEGIDERGLVGQVFKKGILLGVNSTEEETGVGKIREGGL